MRMRFTRAAFVAAALMVQAREVVAQQQPTLEELRKKWMVAVPDAQVVSQAQQSFWRGAPGTSSGSPLAFGPNFRDAYIGGGYQANTRAVKNQRTGRYGAAGGSDGSISAGFGLGNAQEAVGLEVTLTSLSTFRSGIGDRTAFSFKAHRALPGNAAIAVGVENAFIAGGGETDGAVTTYVAASKVAVLQGSGNFFRAVTFSAGLGNGRFRYEEDFLADKQTVNTFGSVGVLVHPQFSAIADWSGQDLALAASIVPLKAFPIILTPALVDVVGTAGNGARFTLGAGIGMRF